MKIAVKYLFLFFGLIFLISCKKKPESLIELFFNDQLITKSDYSKYKYTALFETPYTSAIAFGDDSIKLEVFFNKADSTQLQILYVPMSKYPVKDSILFVGGRKISMLHKSDANFDTIPCIFYRDDGHYYMLDKKYDSIKKSSRKK